MTSRAPSCARRMFVGVVATAFVAAGPLMACSSSDSPGTGTTDTEKPADGGTAELAVTDAWARPALKDANGAIYMTITGGDTDDALTGVELPDGVAEKVEVHETAMDDSSDMDSGDMDSGDMGDHTTEGTGMMTMKPVDSLPIPAGGTVRLEPGGYHVMVVGLQEELAVGDSLDVTLNFDSGATKTLTAEVKES